MKKRNRKIVRVLALVLVLLIVLGAVVGSLVAALAETAPVRSQCAMSIEYLEQEQALHITQRLLYCNPSESEPLTQVVFYAAPNMFRRESALMYEQEDLQAVFPSGFVPGGMEMVSVSFNGEAADWGMQGENELYLRAACAIPAGGSGVIEFEYYVLLTDNAAFTGVGDEGVRLSAFYLIPGIYNDQYREYNVNQPLPFTRWLSAEAMDYDVMLTLPTHYEPACAGSVEKTGSREWHITLQNAREFALAFGKKYRTYERATASGVSIRLMASSRSTRTALDAAVDAVEQCEAWFGDFPQEALTLVQTDDVPDAQNHPGIIFLPETCFEDSESMKRTIRFCVAQQYFGFSAWTEPVSDAWLSDAVSEYIACLLMEQREGHDAFLKYINREWVPALQLTIPGGLNVTSDANLFTGSEYDIVVRTRGAVVLHELRTAMGLEAFIQGLFNFHRMGQDGHTLTEMELVSAMDAADGKSWEAFLTDWVFNVDEYAGQNIDWYE